MCNKKSCGKDSCSKCSKSFHECVAKCLKAHPEVGTVGRAYSPTHASDIGLKAATSLIDGGAANKLSQKCIRPLSGRRSLVRLLGLDKGAANFFGKMNDGEHMLVTSYTPAMEHAQSAFDGQDEITAELFAGTSKRSNPSIKVVYDADKFFGDLIASIPPITPGYAPFHPSFEKHEPKLQDAMVIDDNPDKFFEAAARRRKFGSVGVTVLCQQSIGIPHNGALKVKPVKMLKIQSYRAKPIKHVRETPVTMGFLKCFTKQHILDTMSERM